jgi:anionic cell wall polymer biosynthesis LytR-Cps2A-Psr (LCP) family protein
VDIDVTHPMFDDDYPNDSNTASAYSYTRVDIAPGPQHLTGAEALTYVRTRHADLGGDFGRTDRQQQVLAQIKEKLTQNNTITKAPAILNDLDGYLFTDLTLSQLATFAEVAKGVDINNVDHVSFTNNYSTPAPDPASTNVYPVCSAINAEIQKMFGTPGACQPQYSSIAPPAGTGIASTQPTTTAATADTDSMPNQTSTNTQVASISQSITGGTSTFSNLMNLMLLSVSGSFNAMQ